MMGVSNNVSLLMRRGLYGIELTRSFGCMSRLLAPSKDSGASDACGPSIPDVQGLSKKVVNVPQEKVGPGASKDGDYKHPEYFCFNQISYYEAEIEMAKYRLPQPSNKQ